MVKEIGPVLKSIINSFSRRGSIFGKVLGSFFPIKNDEILFVLSTCWIFLFSVGLAVNEIHGTNILKCPQNQHYLSVHRVMLLLTLWKKIFINNHCLHSFGFLLLPGTNMWDVPSKIFSSRFYNILKRNTWHGVPVLVK